MRSTHLVVGLLAVIAACSEPAVAPSPLTPIAARYSAGNGARVENAREERTYADTVTTCEGDTAAVEATAVVREEVIFLPDGSLRFTYRTVVHMNGTVLTSGAKYIGELSLVDVHVSHGSDSGVVAIETRTIRLHGVTQGPSDNIFETVRFETIYYVGDGSYTFVIKGKAACPG